ncbi:MAG: type VI secretion system baseplate subunit TssK [Acidobacteria bacterium]|nr:type VI secretion system baseplate subunit TssK [Acidobacteriota bacterium]
MITAAHDIPDAIQWHEGMLLAPQHFQELSARTEGLLHYHAAMLAPFHWGVRHLKLDPVLLLEGTFRVLELEAVLPDGLAVSSEDAEPGDLEMDLRPMKDSLASNEMAVHLTVPARLHGASGVQGDWARFRSAEGNLVRDQNTGEAELRIPRLKPRLRLLLAEKPPEKYSSFPLARVSYRNEAFGMTDFVPPMLRVPLQSPIGELCSEVVKRLREKAVFLAERVRAPSSATRVPQLLETKSFIHNMVAPLPPLEALLSSGRAHPFALYQALCLVVGHVAALGRGLVPPVLPPYDHDDPLASFALARSFVFQVVEEGIQEKYTSYPFFLKKGAFYLPMDDDWQGRSLVIGVRAKEGATAEEVERWVEESLIGSKSEIQGMRFKRVRGAGREPFGGDGDLVPARGVQLFSLSPDAEFVHFNESLFIVNLDDPEGARRPVEIVLYVRNKS